MGTVSASKEYCLRGEMGGSERSFPLRTGDNRVGSLEANEVFLPRRGVSRQHATLHVDGDQASVEDLGSKNGTYVSGQRVDRAPLSVGDSVRFGPVLLRFVELHQDDSRLAISLEPAISDQTSVVPLMDSRILDTGVGTELTNHWLRLVEAVYLRLDGKPDGDLGAAIRTLCEELRLPSAALLEIPASRSGDPIVLAASGRVATESTAQLRALFYHLDTPNPPELQFHTEAQGTDDEGRDLPATTVAVLRRPEHDPLVLALWGNFPGRVGSKNLLRLLLRLLEPRRPHPGAPVPRAASRRYPGLSFPSDYVHAQSAVMGKIYELMQSLAQGDLPVLIIGETGVGKEYLGQILHRSSPRRHGPYVAINCAAIPAELLESELFGIGEGVATGVAAKKGRLQLANGGTMFLDEIGDMSSDLQAKLLRALQEKEVHPVGRDPVDIDVRILAATNQALSERIEDGSFRADLYYRLAGYVLEIPPLRKRPEDIPALVEHFLRDCARQLGRPIRGVTVRALRMLMDYPWPGNVRELANEVRRAVYLCPENGNIESSTLSKALQPEGGDVGIKKAIAQNLSEEEATPESSSQELPSAAGLGFDSLDLAQLEGQAVTEALRRCQGNQVRAARLLGISRQSLRRRMERLGLL